MTVQRCSACHTAAVKVIPQQTILMGENVVTNTVYECQECHQKWSETVTLTENKDSVNILFG